MYAAGTDGPNDFVKTDAEDMSITEPGIARDCIAAIWGTVAENNAETLSVDLTGSGFKIAESVSYNISMFSFQLFVKSRI